MTEFGREWHALRREAAIAGAQLAHGVTVLGKANHAENGCYGEAFFSLSIGLERLAKLIVVSEYAIKNHGKFPSNSHLRKIGHDLTALLSACEKISAAYRKGEEFSDRPNDPVHKGIILTLTEFATQTRYYNLDFISGGKASSKPEPIAAWWERVGQPILDKHYSKQQREKDAIQAAMMDSLIGGSTQVLHHDENENKIDSIEAMLLRSGATRIVQKYGRLHVMQIIRWLSFLIDDLSHKGAYRDRIEALLGLGEPFAIFRNPNSYLKGRKTWSIYRP